MEVNIDSRVPMNSGTDIPLLGLGLFRAPAGEATRDAVSIALELGYRHFDTARIYENEADVGSAIRESGIPREEVFVTTKLWNSDHGMSRVGAAFSESLRTIGLDYIDLFLIHWPVEGQRIETWRAMEDLDPHSCRAIGVSNFLKPHLEELLSRTTIRPAVNQIEISPYNFEHRRETVEFCWQNEIAVEAYSPLTKGWKLEDPKLVEIANRYSKTTAQILIRWSLQKGFIVLPKTVRPSRLMENAQVFDFDISEADMQAMDGFNEKLKTGWDPATVR